VFIDIEAFAPLKAVVKRGRFKEEYNVELFLEGERLCHVKIFTGRPPYYTPWAEVFNINPVFIGTEWEEKIYCALHRLMSPGDILYVEYVDDRETFIALQKGEAPEATRLGALLRKCGFKIVKNWYHPEGGLEGGMKLQAVKV